MVARPARLAVVGGGFAGVSAAVQAVRRASAPLDITLFEPAAEVGRGLAYGASDPDHRLNAHVAFHPADPADIHQILRWIRDDRLTARDPESVSVHGVFPRRSDYARYLGDSLRQHAASNPSGSSIAHDRRRVADLRVAASGGDAPVTVVTDDGGRHPVDAAIVAIGNPPPRTPAALADLAGHPAVVVDPFAAGALRRVPLDRPVLVMGTGLTAADALASLLRRGHRGPLLAFSRRGLRPREHRLPDPSVVIDELPADWIVTRMNGPIPAFAEPPAGRPPTVRHLVRALRARIRQTAAEGQPWQAAFDELRDAVWRLWPRLSDREQRRFIDRLRPWYDVNRFRVPPQTHAMIEAALGDGRLHFARHGLVALEPASDGGLHAVLDGRDGRRQMHVGALVNCTGLDLGGRPAPDSLPGRWLDAGRLRPHPCGFGFETDAQCRPLAADGSPCERVRWVGPSTAGTFGDPLGAVFIAMQIHRMLPDLLRTLQPGGRTPAGHP